MLITATPCTSVHGPAQPGLKPPLHQGWWQEVSDGMGQGENLPFPLHRAGDCGLRNMSCFQTSPMLYNCPGLCVAAVLCRELLSTARGAVWPQTGYFSHSSKIFQERNVVSCYDLAVFS